MNVGGVEAYRTAAGAQSVAWKGAAAGELVHRAGLDAQQGGDGSRGEHQASKFLAASMRGVLAAAHRSSSLSAAQRTTSPVSLSIARQAT